MNASIFYFAANIKQDISRSDGVDQTANSENSLMNKKYFCQGEPHIIRDCNTFYLDLHIKDLIVFHSLSDSTLSQLKFER
jgi:hypothetical protein